MITIVKTLPGDSHFHRFTNFPRSIYPPDSAYFKTPENINTTFLRSAYVLLDGDQILARAAVYMNPFLHYQNKLTGCIGNYEAIDNELAATTLIAHISHEARSHGAGYLIGPMNGSTWDQYRFSTDHDSPNFFLEPYHHLYYHGHFQQSGFDVIANYYSNISKIDTFPAGEILIRDAALVQQGVTFRPINLKNYEREITRIHQFNAFAFNHNFLYTPIEHEDFVKKYAAAKHFLHPDYTLMAEDGEGNLVGYYFCLHDHFNTTEKTLIFKTLVRHPGPEWQGLGHVMGNRIYQHALDQGYRTFIHPFIFENGTSTNLSKNFLGRPYKKYVLYGKQIA
jgi:hypothetical protein